MGVSADGYICENLSYSKAVDYSLYAPYDNLEIANLATGSKIGITLNAEGEVLIFKNKKKRGYPSLFSCISRSVREALKNRIYNGRKPLSYPRYSRARCRHKRRKRSFLHALRFYLRRCYRQERQRPQPLHRAFLPHGDIFWGRPLTC